MSKPYPKEFRDDVVRVDRAAVLVAQGHEDAAREFLASAVHNRRDDHQAPIEPPLTTAARGSKPQRGDG